MYCSQVDINESASSFLMLYLFHSFSLSEQCLKQFYFSGGCEISDSERSFVNMLIFWCWYDLKWYS